MVCASYGMDCERSLTGEAPKPGTSKAISRQRSASKACARPGASPPPPCSTTSGGPLPASRQRMWKPSASRYRSLKPANAAGASVCDMLRLPLVLRARTDLVDTRQHLAAEQTQRLVHRLRAAGEDQVEHADARRFMEGADLRDQRGRRAPELQRAQPEAL